jgi:DNA polymerase-3 subunit delta
MIITLTGENTYAATQAERQITGAFAAKHGANGIERIDAEALDAARLPDLFQGATLFAPVRLVVLKNISANKSIQEPLAEVLAKTADETTVVISDAHLDKRTKLYKFLKANTNFQEFPNLDEHKLAAWVQQQVAATNATIAKTDAQYLVQRTGHDQWRLHHEIEKLAGYNSDITRQLIESLVEPSPEGNAFELLDAALNGQSQKVASIVAALKTEEDPYKLFGLLASQVHALAVVMAAGGKSPDIIAKEAGLHPFVVRKTQPIARRLGMAQVQKIAKDVADCDWHLKSTGADPWHLLEVTLQKMAK